MLFGAFIYHTNTLKFQGSRLAVAAGLPLTCAQAPSAAAPARRFLIAVDTARPSHHLYSSCAGANAGRLGAGGALSGASQRFWR
jgi:hypothetical protein